ncbi:hypothetical protein CW748_16690 [Alteromonadales bacterium alter-6D02]|nr:hypothetical protein CW748_16690 [Alteromonadales bacterium alter-6D02]
MNKYKNLLSILALSTLTACGGGGEDDSKPAPTKNNIGVFLDSPVINISYRTDTLEGTTNSQGEFEYVDGERVTFFIGDLTFSSVVARSTVTPFDLAGTSDINSSTVVNITRLLQTLDKDGNPDNGITIDDSAKLSAMPVDFSLSESEFENSSEVSSLITNAGQDTAVTELVSSGGAVAHFKKQLSQAYLSDGDGLGSSTSSAVPITTAGESAPYRSTFPDSNAESTVWFKFTPSESSDYKITRQIIDASPLDDIPSSTVSIALKSEHLEDCINGMDEQTQSCSIFMTSNIDYYFEVRSFDSTQPLFTLRIDKL